MAEFVPVRDKLTTCLGFVRDFFWREVEKGWQRLTVRQFGVLIAQFVEIRVSQ